MTGAPGVLGAAHFAVMKDGAVLANAGHFDVEIDLDALRDAGAAAGGGRAVRPLVEIMYMDFIGVCLDALMNQAAKLRFMTGGGVEIPLVVRTQFGAGRSSGSQHS